MPTYVATCSAWYSCFNWILTLAAVDAAELIIDILQSRKLAHVTLIAGEGVWDPPDESWCDRSL